MATQNSLIRKYRGVIIRPLTGAGVRTWTIRQSYEATGGHLGYIYVNSLRHAREVISNLITDQGFTVIAGELVKKES